MTNDLLLEGQDSLSQGRAFPKLEFNPDDHRDDLKNLKLTREQEDELLHALWHIITMMVDMGWGVEATQIVLPQLFGDVTQRHEKPE